MLSMATGLKLFSLRDKISPRLMPSFFSDGNLPVAAAAAAAAAAGEAAAGGAFGGSGGAGRDGFRICLEENDRLLTSLGLPVGVVASPDRVDDAVGLFRASLTSGERVSLSSVLYACTFSFQRK